MKRIVCLLLTVVCCLLSCLPAIAEGSVDAVPYSFELNGATVTLSSIDAYEAKKTETQENAIVYIATFDLGDFPIDEYSSFFDAFSGVDIIIFYEDGSYDGFWDPLLYVAWVESKTASIVFASSADKIKDELLALAIIADYSSSTPFAYYKKTESDKTTEVHLKYSLYVTDPCAEQLDDLSTLGYYLRNYIRVTCGYEGRIDQ